MRRWAAITRKDDNSQLEMENRRRKKKKNLVDERETKMRKKKASLAKKGGKVDMVLFTIRIQIQRRERGWRRDSIKDNINICIVRGKARSRKQNKTKRTKRKPRLEMELERCKTRRKQKLWNGPTALYFTGYRTPKHRLVLSRTASPEPSHK